MKKDDDDVMMFDDDVRRFLVLCLVLLASRSYFGRMSCQVRCGIEKEQLLTSTINNCGGLCKKGRE